MDSRQVTAKGFTLLEVLVALAVLAIALAASIRATGGAARNAEDLRLRTLANWVAEDRMAELRLQKSVNASGETQGERSVAGESLVWRQTIVTTPNVRFLRVEIEVAAASGGRIVRHIGYLVRP